MFWGNYWSIPSPPVQQGCTHEGVAIKAYEQKTWLQFHHCGIFFSWENSFLGASLDHVLVGDDGELKSWKWNAHTSIISMLFQMHAEKDFHSELVDGQAQLWKTHNYHFQVKGQLANTEADFCDFVTCTCNNLHVGQGLSGQSVVGWNVEKNERLLLHFPCTWNQQ